MAATALALAAVGASCESPKRGAIGPGSGTTGPADAPTAEPTASAPSTTAAATSPASPSWLPEPKPIGPAPQPPVQLAGGGAKAVASKRGMVVSVEPHATRIGAAVLERGGNAIDAAVAVGYALAVTHPNAGALGGGGFMVIRRASGEVHAVDYREMCPVGANAQTNERQLAAGAHGYASAPVPGVVAGLNLARAHFGTLPLAELIAPAVELARAGHPFGERQAWVLGRYWERVSKDPTFRAIFGKNKPVGRGHRLKQPRLAETLEAVAARGNAGFYGGKVAQRIAAAMSQRGGYVTTVDLARYRAKLRQPLRFLYRGFEVCTMPPPSMGGIALSSIMLGLEQARAYETKPGSALGIHLYAEAARRAYADRRAVATDPAFGDRDLLRARLGRLLDPHYYATRQPPIDPAQATPSVRLVPLVDSLPARPESPETTHFSVVDSQGNAVSCTTTLSAAFGAWVVPPETGVILSNSLGGFSSRGVNAIAAGKRMASSMTPAIVLQDGKLVAVLGSPGGDTIPGTVAQVLRNLVDYQMPLDQAVDAGRVHHQYKPDLLRVEPARSPPRDVLQALEKRSHVVRRHGPQGDANCILFDPGSNTAYGYVDERQGGLALGPVEPDESP